MYHNIEKSTFRPGQYVGYGAGIVWRIVKRARDYYATPRSMGWHSGFACKTLKQVSAKLEAMPMEQR